jgi:hypothetical protein
VNSFPIVAVQACPLCCSSGPLCESHIIPHFVIQWLRESSATGHIRFGETPNLRVQDGHKQPLLCATCEGLLSGWERETAERLFKPYHRDSEAVLFYGPWLAKFCASLCWRVLFIYRGVGHLEHLSEQQLKLVSRALDFWRDMMFDRRQHPGEFELHVLPVPGLHSAEGFDLPPNMNRYFARGVEADVGANDKSVFVQVKLCRLFVIGFVQMPNAREWKGTRVKMRRGSVGGQNYFLPRNFGDYLVERAKHVASLHASISEPQKQKIEAAMRKDMDRTASSDTFEAMSQDVEMFGPAALRRPKQ